MLGDINYRSELGKTARAEIFSFRSEFFPGDPGYPGGPGEQKIYFEDNEDFNTIQDKIDGWTGNQNDRTTLSRTLRIANESLMRNARPNAAGQKVKQLAIVYLSRVPHDHAEADRILKYLLHRQVYVAIIGEYLRSEKGAHS